MRFSSEAETVIKRILPYLLRRGYDTDKDMSFEDPVAIVGTARRGFIDILITCGRANPAFLIEAKRDGTAINAKHREQALEYGASIGVLLVAITNGRNFELLNTTTKKPLMLNGSALDKIPSKKDLISEVVRQLKREPQLQNIQIAEDRSLPFRPGLPLSKLNHLIKQCHNLIRKIEKNEEHAFSDFSKFMFLKLLEEKWDQEGTVPPYSFTFHELAALPRGKGDQIKTAIKSMIGTIQENTPYGSVLADPIELRVPATYQKIVKQIAAVSFSDCDLDSKGAAFEYFVRATLKGKKLGQYFTPRPLVKLMLGLGRWEQIVNSLAAGEDFKVIDPACGTGGFCVLAMNQSLDEVDRRLKARAIHKATADSLSRRIKETVFYGIDAHEGVACSAKMNMIIAGDGYNNIRFADSPNESKLIPPYPTFKDQNKICDDGKAHLILTNPPFGTSEAESLSSENAQNYAVPSTRGQSLFIQLMIRSAHSDSLIVTVIDEGVLNTASYAELRRHILKTCRVEAVLALPTETFKPNKINVKSSVLVLRKREESDEDLIDNYPIAFISIHSLGYEGSGDDIRGFDLACLINEVTAIDAATLREDDLTKGYNWSAFEVHSKIIAAEKSQRLDVRFWHPTVRAAVSRLKDLSGIKSIKELNKIETRRGESPPVAEYVSKSEGHALVVKSGSNISKTGELIIDGDYIELALYQEYVSKGLILEDGDILLASTGDGTLGKCCVYRNKNEVGETNPGVPEGHVTLIRVDQTKVYPEYLCDYLRKGFGQDQLYRVFTGSTGMIEVTPEDVDGIVVPPLPSLREQKRRSTQLRKSEKSATEIAERAVATLLEGTSEFRQVTLPIET
jgi:type I restriction enzyme M protein